MYGMVCDVWYVMYNQEGRKMVMETQRVSQGREKQQEGGE